ncbi:hypothetical protein BCV70DRAFT_198733 [Testicularia cyperi]|uniref:Zn(2)-C6 fungal-type domain-containing protein n=1 Tax=Testicularia cyperi TaxID=1882483 RepID=A0A317XSG7_9BASI|nr:hypothetical protein BCV70DRAFT_198733 [Testicularia cyperi]
MPKDHASPASSSGSVGAAPRRLAASSSSSSSGAAAATAHPYSASSSSSTTTTTTPSKILACVACRNSKVKCLSNGPEQCKRCLDHGLTCIRPEYQRLKKAKAKLARFQRDATVTKDLETQARLEVDEGVDRPPAKPQPSSVLPTTLFSTNGFYGRSAQLLSDLHIVRPDVREEWDPVLLGIMSPDVSHQLFSTFMVKLEALLSFFDPRIHSYEYIRSSSCLLFTTMCWLAATVSDFPSAGRVMLDLKHHIDTVLLPSIYLHNLRSVEIVQGFLMLAAYLRPAHNPSEDRSWTLLGHAIRTATDLDMHSRILSTSQLPQHQHLSSAPMEASASHSLAGSAAAKPTAQRIEIWQQRNKERAWMHIWLHEASSSQYTGRVSLLAKDPIVEASRGWHLHPEALHTDVVFVALIELRSLLAQNKEMFRMLSARSSAGASSNGSTPLNGYGTAAASSSSAQPSTAQGGFSVAGDNDAGWIRHYLDRCHRDLSSWEERWVVDPVRSGSQPRPLRLELGSLYICYGRMQLLSLPLQTTSLQSSLITRIVSDLYTVSIRYLEDFVDRTSPQRIAHSYNSICVTATYAVVIALKLTKLAPSYPFIDSTRILHLVAQVSRYMREGGNLTPHQNGSSLSYARYIDRLLDMEGNSNGGSSGNTTSVNSATNNTGNNGTNAGIVGGNSKRAQSSNGAGDDADHGVRDRFSGSRPSDMGRDRNPGVPHPAYGRPQPSPSAPYSSSRATYQPGTPGSDSGLFSATSGLHAIRGTPGGNMPEGPMPTSVLPGATPLADPYRQAPDASLLPEVNIPQWGFLANDPELFAWARSFLDDELDIPISGPFTS